MPAVSLVIPVLNEAESISQILQHVREVDADGPAEIIVVDGDPEEVRSTRSGRGRAYRGAVKGRARQMNSGAGLATGDILLFLHADTRLPPKAFTLIRTAMNDTGVVGGAFDLGSPPREGYSRSPSHTFFLRTRLTKIPFWRPGHFCPARFFQGDRGYRDLPLMEDVDLMQRIRKRGGRICIIPEKVRTSPRSMSRKGSCTPRSGCDAAAAVCAWCPS